jgi:hypothetical protein
MRGHRLFGGATLDQAQQIGRRIGQQHVVEDGQIAHQGHFLEGGLDAAAMRSAWRS